MLKNLTNNNLSPSERPIGTFSQQILGYKDTIANLFESYGMDAQIATQLEPGVQGSINNGFLGATIEYADPKLQWIDFIADQNGSEYENWIKSGKDGPNNIYPGIDDSKVYEKVLGGTWAPYKLTSKDKSSSPKWSHPPLEAPTSGLTLNKLASVDIVFTSDQSKWTRAAVLELNSNPAAQKFDLRKSPSLNKSFVSANPTDPANFDVNSPSYLSSTGMSWFPGYAINIETGERLNIAFGENSTINSDMQWNPTTVRYDTAGNPVFGGMHYIYIFGHNGDTPNDCPRYDGGKWIQSRLKTLSATIKRAVFKDAMWVACPMLKTGQALNATECTVKLRVTKNFAVYDTRKDLYEGDALVDGVSYKVLTDTATYKGVKYPAGTTFTADASSLNFTGFGSVVGGGTLNNSNPFYLFSTDSLLNKSNNPEAAKSALDLINIVPNPYYAWSAYETNQIDNRVRITNLPPKCKVTIFTMNGVLVQTYNRSVASDNSAGGTVKDGNNTSTSLDWDLKNRKGIPVSSGLYLIHIDAPGLGEVTLKFFAVMRPVDLDTF